MIAVLVDGMGARSTMDVAGMLLDGYPPPFVTIELRGRLGDRVETATFLLTAPGPDSPTYHEIRGSRRAWPRGQA